MKFKSIFVVLGAILIGVAPIAVDARDYNNNRGGRSIVINNNRTVINNQTNVVRPVYGGYWYGGYYSGCGYACQAGIVAGTALTGALLSEIITDNRARRERPQQVTIINQYPEPIGPNDPSTCRYVNYGQGWDARAQRSFPVYRKVC